MTKGEGWKAGRASVFALPPSGPRPSSFPPFSLGCPEFLPSCLPALPLSDRRDRAGGDIRRIAFVEHLLEKQPRRRRCEACRRVGVFVEQPGGGLGRQAAAADLDEHADDAADHLPEKMRSLDGDQNQLAFLDELHAVDEDARRPRLLPFVARVGGGKRAEVAQADDRACSLAHARNLERLLHPPDVAFRERRAAARDLIEVAARDRVVARVKAVRHLRRREDVDVRRQLVVDPPAQRLGGQRRRDVEVRHLRERVYACVGAAGSVQLEIPAAGHRPDGAIDFALHRSGVLLDLPAAVARPRVLDRQLVAGHAKATKTAKYNPCSIMVEGTRTPRLVVTDTLGRRIVNIDKPLFTIGRRSETDLRLAGADISRVHAEIAIESSTCIIRDKQSRFGTFVNGEQITERPLAHGDKVRLGQSPDIDIVFFIDDEAPSVERSAVSAAIELRQMAALLEGLRALGSGRVLDEVLAMVLDSAIDVTGAERGFIMLAPRGKSLEFKLARARGKVTLSGRTFETSRKIPETVFATGQQTIVEDLLDGDFAAQHTGTVALGIRHVLCTPLRLVRYVEREEQRGGNEAIGVLYLDSRERGALSSQSTQSALETLSAEAAIAIENARLYREALDKAKFEQELRVAAAIQQALLPASNRTGAFFTTAAASVPCRAVGGDFYDYVDLPSGAFGFILGDVAGKGSPAALLAAAVLGMFSVEAMYQPSAAGVTTRLNHGLFRRSIEARFLTTFYGILRGDGSFAYCNAGRNPPFLVTASAIRRLDTGGVVLGLFEQASFDEEALNLKRGDIIVAFSDGVSEALNEAGEEFSDDRLLACL